MPAEATRRRRARCPDRSTTRAASAGSTTSSSRSSASTSVLSSGRRARLRPARSLSSTTPMRSCSASAWAGAARGTDRAVGVTLGTGLGSAFLARGGCRARARRCRPTGAPPRLVPRPAGRGDDLARGSDRALRRRRNSTSRRSPRAPARGDARARGGVRRARSGARRVPRAVARSFARDAASSSAGRSRAPGTSSSPRCGARSRTLQRSRRSARRELLDDAALLGAARHVAAWNDVCVESSFAVVGGRRPRAAQVAAWRRERLAAGARPLHGSRSPRRGPRRPPAPWPRTSGRRARDRSSSTGLCRSGSTDRPDWRALPVCVWLPGGAGCSTRRLRPSPRVAASRWRRRARSPASATASRRSIRFRRPLEDVVAATRWLVERARRARARPEAGHVGGASAGANLAAAVTLVARGDDDLVLAAQVLVYPVLARDLETSLPART